MERLGRATWPEKPRGSGEGDGNRPKYNRYIDDGSKRDQTTDLRGVENSYAEYDLVAHGSLAAARRPRLQRAGECIVSGL